MTNKKIPDAAESNAGDDFHILWTIRKCIELLNFDPDGLKAVSVEGLTAVDEAKLDPFALLGADLTEYYGGRNAADASKIVISQLKYSTRHSTQPWTASKICTGKKGDYNGSIIHRLGTLYRELSDKLADKSAFKDFQIKLVSNRPVDTKLNQMLIKCQTLIRNTDTVPDYPSLVLALDDKEKTELSKIYNASKLPEDKFVRFLNLLDFSECQAGSNFEQKQKSIAALGALGSILIQTQIAKLREMVWNKMLPSEMPDHQSIYLENVLYEFGIYDLSGLLPVSNKIELPANMVPRAQLQTIIDQIIKSKAMVCCLHGGAGIGKSTFVRMIPEQLPAFSKAVIFDCYGGGAYTDVDDKRHKPENAYLQLCNMLAIETGSPFLIETNGSNDYFLREFRNRVILAIKIVREVNPDAIICIIIDAADNSVTAADLYHSPTFVHELVRLPLPEGCKILVSSRTGRVHTLNLPDDVEQMLITPFTLEETAIFLKPHYPDLLTEQVSEFADLTRSIPRVMSYAIETPGLNLEQKTQVLRPDGKSIDELFKLSIRESEIRAGDPISIKQFLGFLVALPRPVPFKFIKELCSLTEHQVEDLRTDLWKGLKLTEEHITFRDEDFETYLRKTYPPTPEMFVQIAKLFLRHAALDDYASTHLAAFLYEAELKEDLLATVLHRQLLDHPRDPIKNKEVFIERARLAMKMVRKPDLNYLKLQLLAAEAAKSNQILEDILLNKADLAAAYGNFQTNQKLYAQSGHPEWFGRVHFRSAAVFSRKPETRELAAEHLTNGRNWVRYRETLSEERKENYELSPMDLAFALEATLRMDGLKKVIDWVSYWSPKSFIYEVLELLIINIIAIEKESTIAEWLSEVDLRVDIRLLIIKLFFSKGLKPPIATGSILSSKTLLTRIAGKFQFELQESLLCFVEFGLREGHGLAEMEPFLNLLAVPKLEEVPKFNTSYHSEAREQLDFSFRIAAIYKFYREASFSIGDFYPDKLKSLLASKKPEEVRNATESKKEYDDVYKHFIPVYTMRAEFLFKRISGDEAALSIATIFDNLKNDWELSYRYNYQTNSIYTFLSIKLLDIVFFTKGEKLSEQICTALADRKGSNISNRLIIASKLSEKKEFAPVTLQVLQTIAADIDKQILPGQDIIGYYTSATITASRISGETGKYFFDKMVLASEKIDTEAMEQISSIKAMLEVEKDIANPALSIQLAKYLEYCSKILSGMDGFPWDDGIMAIAKLDIRNAWAQLCRFDHRNIRDFNLHLVSLIEESIDQKFIDHLQAAALLKLNAYKWADTTTVISFILKGFDAQHNSKLKSVFVKDHIRSLKLVQGSSVHTENIASFYEQIKDGRFLEAEIVKDLRNYIETIHSFTDQQKPESGVRNEYGIPYELNIALGSLLWKTNVDETLDLEKVFAELRHNPKIGNFNEPNVIETLRQKVKPGAEITFLNQLIKLGENSISYYAFETCFENLFGAWNHVPNIITWKKANYHKVLRTWLPLFTSRNYLDYGSLKTMALLFEVNEPELSIMIVDLLPDLLNDISANVLYQLIRITSQGVGKTEKLELIDWALQKWIAPIPDDFGDGPFRKELVTTGTSQEIVGDFFRYNLGHPYKKVRWRAAHGLRLLASLNTTDIIHHLLATQNNWSIGTFQHEKSTFFWISAKLYLWISLERICKENPGFVSNFSSYLWNEIKDLELPHVLLKYFVQSACLCLIKYDGNLFNSTQQDVIQGLLKGRLNKTKTPNSPKLKRTSSPEIRFKFDTLDTLRYWYEPLGNLFGITDDDVAVIADKFITEKWGFTGNPVDLDHVRRNNYTETSNRDGSEPALENLRTYYEYHAMFCTAYELLQQKQLLTKEDYHETWEEWIKGWGLCWPDSWLADFRDHPPLEKKYWIDQSQQQDWEWAINPGTFEEALGMLNPDQDYITIGEDSNIYRSKDYEKIYINAGLIDIRTGPALLRALQTANSLDVYLPIDEEYVGFDDDPKPEGEFTIAPFMLEDKTDIDGIDDQDPLFADIIKRRKKPVASFLKFGQLALSEDYRITHQIGNINSWASKFQSWNDVPKEPAYSGFHSAGYKMIVRKNALLEYLAHIQKCMIIHANINRHVEHRTQKLPNAFYPDYCIIYLIHPNGAIETLRGNDTVR